ncbi:MAG: DUF3052 domain-containing protein [Bacteroidetes bacterium]|nr:DUF3052 domain-containing protein [Bacteroidota bacterium]
MAGYSGTPLQKKLGIKAGKAYISAEPTTYWDAVAPLPDGFVRSAKPAKESLDFAHVFVKEKSVFEKEFLKVKGYLKKDGTFWVSWPKRASKVVTDLDENIIRDFGLANGLVDVKVCAVDEVWSGLKFMFRLKDR